MKSRIVAAGVVALGILAMIGAGALAQNAPGGTAPMPHGRRHMRGMAPTGAMPGTMQGQIIGDRKTRVYHLPGDNGQLPKEKNRVYFRTEAEAQAAGYHAAHTRHRTGRRVPKRDTKTGRFTKTPGGR